jgi:hypothetical protein
MPARRQPLPPPRPPRAAAAALSTWLLLAVCGAGWALFAQHTPEHQAELSERFQKGTQSFHRAVGGVARTNAHDCWTLGHAPFVDSNVCIRTPGVF